MKRVSIKWHLFTYLLFFCALLLMILWLFQTVLLGTFYRALKVNEIKSNAVTISKNIDSQDLSSLLETIAKESDCYIEILSSDGERITSSGNMKDSLFDGQISSLLSKVKNGDYIEYITNTPPNRKDDFKETAPNDRGPNQSIVYLKTVGDQIILINSMISPVNATITTLRYQLYVITGIMLIFSILLAIFIAKRVSNPIEKLNNSAKNLAKGNYDITFNNSGYKEINELSGTLTVAAIELNKVENLRRELMANISHDLRTPLSLIYGYAEVMHDFPQDITREQTQAIMDEIQRLSSLVNDVFDISNLEAGTQKLHKEVFPFTASLKLTTDRIAELVKKDGYHVSFHYNSEIILNADEVKLTQAYYNLLINAINYSGADKEVHVNQIVNGNVVKIEVYDSGEGIAKENLKHIWDRYYRVDKSHKRSVTGSGLGLSIVKKVIELHGGKYGVISEPGKGSMFWFSLKI